MARRLQGGLIIALMLIGGFSLWTVIPLGWLWIGSQVVGTQEPKLWAYMLVLAGIIVSVIAVGKILAVLNGRFLSLQGENYSPKMPLPWLESMRDQRHSQRATVLDMVLVASALLAGAALLVWFLLLAGSPLPSQ
jgi:hypothetical protein